jgi:type II secretory ATPase GspE/PulE/Tfp pilus assembly ATPase PilB-like protein
MGIALMKPAGCEIREGKSYRGRIAAHELLVNSLAIRLVIKHKAGVDKLTEVAQETGMRTLRQAGINRIFLGIQSPAAESGLLLRLQAELTLGI